MEEVSDCMDAGGLLLDQNGAGLKALCERNRGTLELGVVDFLAPHIAQVDHLLLLGSAGHGNNHQPLSFFLASFARS
jgi:hypothetical protein